MKKNANETSFHIFGGEPWERGFYLGWSRKIPFSNQGGDSVRPETPIEEFVRKFGVIDVVVLAQRR
jgi:hypothetical protein